MSNTAATATSPNSESENKKYICITAEHVYSSPNVHILEKSGSTGELGQVDMVKSGTKVLVMFQSPDPEALRVAKEQYALAVKIDYDMRYDPSRAGKGRGRGRRGRYNSGNSLPKSLYEYKEDVRKAGESSVTLVVNPEIGGGNSSSRTKFSPISYSPVYMIGGESSVPGGIRASYVHSPSGMAVWMNLDKRKVRLGEIIRDTEIREKFPEESGVWILREIDQLIVSQCMMARLDADKIEGEYGRFQKVVGLFTSASIEGERKQAMRLAIKLGSRINGISEE